MLTLTPEMEALKSHLKSTWMSGNYAEFARPMEPGALEFLERLRIPSGAEMLDAGCGAGQIAIPAARAGVRVTAIDLATNWVEHARTRARSEGLDMRIDEGDVEALDFPDGSFDVVVSLVAAMFAPRPEQVAAELVRVTRSGGRIAMANWTPEGFVGRMFKVVAAHVPPPALMPSPLEWGVESKVRERFRDGIRAVHVARRKYRFQYSFAPREVVEFYARHYGPMNRAFAALDGVRQAALRADLERLWSEHNLADDGTTRYDGEYLEVIAVRA